MSKEGLKPEQPLFDSLEKEPPLEQKNLEQKKRDESPEDHLKNLFEPHDPHAEIIGYENTELSTRGRNKRHRCDEP